jgi:hypothetical protein
MGTLRKYLFNGAVLTSLLSGVQSLRQQRGAPKDWRTYLGWIAWGLTTAVAIGTVRINSIEESKPEALRKPKTATGPKIVKKTKK